MNRYTIRREHPHRHYIQILFEAKVAGSTTELRLPTWRPGRYELQNYAKNIRKLVITDENGVALTYKKVTSSEWHIYTIGAKYIRVSYEYYANQLDAGASFSDETQLYINPCNCLMYLSGKEKEVCELHIEVPEHFRIACSLPEIEKRVYRTKDFHALADSPFIASPDLKHSSFAIDDTTIHLWFQGEIQFHSEKVIRDFHAYTRYQKEIFGGIPTREYHYLYQMLPYRFHHGVEHMSNTVIALGPDSHFDSREFYIEFLGISSHEFFHLWNVKRIRPEEMWPYDYSRENFAETGWIYEGVTTYYGDISLLRTGVIDFDEWAKTFGKHLQKHYDNDGRYNYSVAESSFDTWLDGYSQGAPGRKVNIYTEGMLAAFILDVYIQKATQGEKSLDDVMRKLYEETWLKQKGYSRETYQRIAEQVCGQTLEWYFSNIVHGRGYIEKYLPEALSYVGLELCETTRDFLRSKCGILYSIRSEKIFIDAIWPESPADLAGIDTGLIMDAINGKPVSEYSGENLEGIKISGMLRGREKEYYIQGTAQNYYLQMEVRQSGQNLENYLVWSNR